jgi:uncharacterized protein (DUF1499 family)
MWSNLVLLASIICLGAIVVAIFGVRGEWLNIRSAFTTINYASQAGLAIIMIAVCVLILARWQLTSSLKSILAIILVIVPVLNQYANQPAETPPGPPINDISTDTTNPPIFNAVTTLRPENSNSIDYPGASAAARQKTLYPDIAPIQSTLSAQEAFMQSVNIATDMGWNIVFKDLNTGLIEAVASTAVFNFKDDVIIRIQSSDLGSVIDIRSHSRIGRGDRGKNAERVRQFIEAFN